MSVVLFEGNHRRPVVTERSVYVVYHWFKTWTTHLLRWKWNRKAAIRRANLVFEAWVLESFLFTVAPRTETQRKRTWLCIPVLFWSGINLLDTEKYRFREQKEAMRGAFRISYDRWGGIQRVPLGMPYAPNILKASGEDLDLWQSAWRYRRKLTDEKPDGGIDWAKPGAEELLKIFAQKGVRTAIATAEVVGSYSSLLKRAGLYDHSTTLFHRQVAHGKTGAGCLSAACRTAHVCRYECAQCGKILPNGMPAVYSGCKVFMQCRIWTQPDAELRNLYTKSGITCSTKGVLNFSAITGIEKDKHHLQRTKILG